MKEIFKPRLFSSNTSRLHTRLTKLLLFVALLLACFVLPFIRKLNSLMNALDKSEYSWLRLTYISMIVNIIHYCCLCILFTFILVVFFGIFLFICLPFFWCHLFVGFVYNFNVKRCESKTSVYRIFVYLFWYILITLQF